MNLKSQALVLLAGLALLVGGPVGAITIDDALTPDVENKFEDQNREAFVDVDGDGTLSVGDVFVGFVRLDNVLPAGESTVGSIYAVISNQVIAISGTAVILGATTVDGLRLEQLTGDVNTTGGLYAVYDVDPAVADLIAAPPVGATSMVDYINYITANMDLRLTLGFADANDFVNALIFLAANLDTSLYPTLGQTTPVGLFQGGLSVLYNNTSFEYQPIVQATDIALGGATSLHQVAINSGTIGGFLGEGNQLIWGNLGLAGFDQCLVDNGQGGTTSVACGFTTKADFFVAPTRVPEPASIALLGLGLLGLAAFRRRMHAA